MIYSILKNGDFFLINNFAFSDGIYSSEKLKEYLEKERGYNESKLREANFQNILDELINEGLIKQTSQGYVPYFYRKGSSLIFPSFLTRERID